MHCLLRGHVFQQRARVGVAEHGELAGIDARRAVLAGAIDPDHARDAFARGRIARQPPFAGLARGFVETRIAHRALQDRRAAAASTAPTASA
jgi:hypothetical protein